MDETADIAEELAAIAGVEDAELSVGDTGLTGVRVRLAADADPDGVGRAVQEVMTRHGVRARLGTAAPPAPPTVGSPVVALADHAGTPLQPIADASIAGVSVTETAGGLEVSVTSADGRSAGQRCRGGDDAIAEAVTIAASELHGGPGAVLVEYRRQAIADVEVVVVVVDAGSAGRRAGASVVGAAFPFAVARAVWSALGG